MAIPVTPGTPSTPMMQTVVASGASTFSKGNKRTSTEYPVLSNKNLWSSWSRSVTALANSHNCLPVLDSGYIPNICGTDPDADELFKEQKKFMFSALTHAIQFPEGLLILRKYSVISNKTTFGDSQALWRELELEFNEGLAALLNAEQLENELRAIQLTNNWNKMFGEFFVEWKTKLADLELVAEPALDDGRKLQMLRSAVKGHSEFLAYTISIETQLMTQALASGTTKVAITYNHLITCLCIHAKSQDANTWTRVNQRRQTNSGKSSKQGGSNGEQSTRGGPYVPKQGEVEGIDYVAQDKWATMDQADRRAWWNAKRARKDREQDKAGNASGTNNRNVKTASRTESAPIPTVPGTESGGVTQTSDTRPGTTGPTTTNGNGNDTNPGHVMRNLLHNQSQRTSAGEDTLIINGRKYHYQANVSRMTRRTVASRKAKVSQVTRRSVTRRNFPCSISATKQVHWKEPPTPTPTSKNTQYHIKSLETAVDDTVGSLMDTGANGGLMGSDMVTWDEVIHGKADITGITNNSVEDLPIQTGAAVIQTHKGSVIGVFHQYANYGKGKSIHSVHQLQSFGNVVDTTAKSFGGRQCLTTPCGYFIPLHIRDGLAYMDMRAPTEKEMSELPTVFFTSDAEWNPKHVDNEWSEQEIVQALGESGFDNGLYGDRINDFGELTSITDYEAKWDRDLFIGYNARTDSDEARDRQAIIDGYAHDTYVDHCLRDVRIAQCSKRTVSIHHQQVDRKTPDYEALRPNFGWLSAARIRKTLENTTQWYRATIHHPFKKHFKSRFPAANVHRLNEWVATDTIFSDTPAHDDGVPGHGGATMLQLYAGKESSYLAGFPMKHEGQIPGTAQDFIRKVGAPIGWFSDNAKAACGNAMKDIARMYNIDDRQSEPHHQHQNYAERRIQDVKNLTNNIMDRTGTPKEFWLLCMLYVIFLLNHMINETTGQVPHTHALGAPTDNSALMSYHWWEPVYYSVDNSFPSTSGEMPGVWAGVAEDQGDALTYKVISQDTKRLLSRSAIRPCNEPLHPNFRANFVAYPSSNTPADGGGTTPQLTSVTDYMSVDPASVILPSFSPEDLLGTTFLLDEENGTTVRARVMNKVNDRNAANHEKIKFIIQVGEGSGSYEEIMAYNELSDLIERQHEAEANGEMTFNAFKEVKEHEGPLRSNDPRYKGSAYNAKVEWQDGTSSWEPIGIMIQDDPVTMALYAQEHGLLDTPGWKSLKRLAKRGKLLKRMVKQSRLQSRRNTPKYKFGVLVPQNYADAIRIDTANGNNLWGDAIKAEMEQLFEYKTFESIGKGAAVPDGHTNIRVHFVFDVKQSLKRKARLVAGGHMTDPPKESVYSGVVSLRSLRIITLIAEMNDLKLMAADIGNAYLEAYTREKITFTAGPEFGELAGHRMRVIKAFYGLRTSGARFHEKFADTLAQFGFKPSFADPDVWLRDAGDVYEYICVYVDDLLCAMRNPKAFMDALQAEPHNYKLKGVDEPKYHLGGDFFRDSDGTLCYGAQTYIKRLLTNYEVMFGEKPKEFNSPLDKKDHPELDTTELCSVEDIAKFQSIIGSLQWAISLCRFDISVAVMTLSRYRAAPRNGHLDRAKRIVGYLRKYPHGTIRFRTGIPTHEREATDYDWLYSVYGNVSEMLPMNMPPPKGKPVRTTTYTDANLYHDYTTGRSVTGILTFINQTPIEWYSKRQGCVETATYGSEFTAARTATEQIMDLRYTLRMFGVPIDGPAWMFGDNESVITQSNIPHSMLNKRHNALSYHRVRESIAAGVLYFLKIKSAENPSDILTKFLDHSASWHIIEPILFWKGNTLCSTNTSLSPN